MSHVPPSGDQWRLGRGELQATVVEVGGGLRELTAGGRPVLHGYPEAEQAGGGRGQLLVPWPNRIRDGRYHFGDQELQLALSEPARANATHGLVRWSCWTLSERSPSALRVTCRLRPQQGWAWSLDLAVDYTLEDDGLTVTPRARNVGTTPAPFGFGAHPYLTCGQDRVDEIVLTVPAATALEVDDRLLPVGDHPVDGTDADFRDPRPIGPTELDQAYTDLAAGDDGRWRVRLEHGGHATELWAEAAAYRYAQVFTGDTLPPAQARTTGLAVEPMTCPANAFNSGDGLLVLAPGQTWSASWGVTVDPLA